MYTIAICDDDEKFCFYIEDLIHNYFNSIKEGYSTDVYFSGEGLYDAIANGKWYDFVFLDIELYQWSGIDVGKKIRYELNIEVIQIIYISSFKEYMGELFRIRPLEFLPKPINQKQITDTLDLGLKMYPKEYIFSYQIGKEYYRLPIQDILYFMSKGKEVEMITINNTVSFYNSLKNVHDKLKGMLFVHVSRFSVVNYKYIVKFSPNDLTMINGDVLTVGKGKYQELIRIQQKMEKKWYSDGGI